MHLDYLLHAPKVCHATTLHGKRPSFQTTELWRKGMNSLRQELELWMMDCPPSIWTACVLPRDDCIVHCPFASSCRRVTIESDGHDTIPNWMSSSLDTNCSNHLIRKRRSGHAIATRDGKQDKESRWRRKETKGKETERRRSGRGYQRLVAHRKEEAEALAVVRDRGGHKYVTRCGCNSCEKFLVFS
ncbi:unnamed protein product [Musa acuminata var. zebrina]